MIVPCPQCASKMEVPDDAAGKQTTCPSCSHTFMIQAPETVEAVQAVPSVQASPVQADPKPASPAPPADPSPVAIPQSTPRQASAAEKIRQYGIWRYQAFGAAVLVIAAFFLPWWSFTFSLEGMESHLAEAGRLKRKNEELQRQGQQADWQEAQKFQADVQTFQQADQRIGLEIKADMEKAGKEIDSDFSDGLVDEKEFQKDLEKELMSQIESTDPSGEVEVGETFHGWSFVRGIISLILAALAAVLLAVAMFVPAVRRFGWAISAPAAAMGIAIGVLALTFVLAADTADFDGKWVHASQTLREGAWLTLAGGGLLAILAGIDVAVSLLAGRR
ncbi:MAG: hypothetical protein ACOCZE_01380 [Planctomycetota bacterium]